MIEWIYYYQMLLIQIVSAIGLIICLTLLKRPRNVVFYFILRKIFRHSEGTMLKWYHRIIHWIIFPVNSFYWDILEKTANVKYDFPSQCVIIDGMKYSMGIFDTFKHNTEHLFSYKYVKENKTVLITKHGRITDYNKAMEPFYFITLLYGDSLENAINQNQFSQVVVDKNSNEPTKLLLPRLPEYCDFWIVSNQTKKD